MQLNVFVNFAECLSLSVMWLVFAGASNLYIEERKWFRSDNVVGFLLLLITSNK